MTDNLSYSYRVHNGGFVITSDWHVFIAEGMVTVPKGFVCDLASVPRPFQIIPGLSCYELGTGSVFHDWAYRNRGQVAADILISRRRADAVFLMLMRAEDVRWATVAWLAVRLFGWLAWRRLPKKDHQLQAV